MKIPFAAALGLALASCATSPDQADTFAVPYQRLADCVYERLLQTSGPGLTKADTPTSQSSRIALEPGGTTFFEVVISAAPGNRSRAAFKPFRNIWGSDIGGSQRVWSTIQACGAGS